MANLSPYQYDPECGHPTGLGYRMPAEWERHLATWFTWPRPEGISFPERFEVIPPVYAALVNALAESEEVHFNVWNDEMEHTARSLLKRHGATLDHVHFHHFPAYEPWCRDHGPVFLVRDRNGNRERAIVDWDYNAWGGKYPPYDLDDVIPQHVAALRGLPWFKGGIVMEGGAIDVNGAGTLLTTESCLLNPNRNPTLSKNEIEQRLKDYLGVRQVLWLGDGIEGDDTDGHVDDLSRFVSTDTIVTLVEHDSADFNYPLLEDNLRRLNSMRAPDGSPFNIVELPTPGRIEFQGQRLPASYANFYIANQAVLVPTFRHPNDSKAVGILQQLFSDRRVVGIDSTDLIWGLGSFHCISQQEPAP